MDYKERIMTFPIMGKRNSEIVKKFGESIGFHILVPPPITDKTIKLGAKYSPNMMCLPFKVTLGSFIEALELGANTLLMYDSKGRCRFRQYNKLHEFILREELGYKFDMYVFTLFNLIPKLSDLSGFSKGKILMQFLRCYKDVLKSDGKSKTWSRTRPNIGIIGEVYCASEEKVNYGLEDKIRAYGGNPYNTAKMGDFVRGLFKERLRLNLLAIGKERKLRKKVEGYFNGPLGGHSFANLYNLFDMIERGVDGIVHVLPLSCSPETLIEPYINNICRDSKIPLLRIPIDENSAEANLCTRLETFCELINLRRKNGR